MAPPNAIEVKLGDVPKVQHIADELGLEMILVDHGNLETPNAFWQAVFSSPADADRVRDAYAERFGSLDLSPSPERPGPRALVIACMIGAIAIVVALLLLGAAGVL